MKSNSPSLVMPRLAAWTMILWAEAGYGLELPGVFSDNMVLQQGIRIPVWGFAEPGQEVTGLLGKQGKTAVADATGVWKLSFDPMEAGGPHTLAVRAGEQTTVLRNVLIGEVWLLAGQSNMQMTLKGTLGSEQAIQESANPRLRLFKAPFLYSPFPLRHGRGEWRESSPQTAPGFSAVGYYFGRRLQKELNVPVGLIQACWGGTLAESWMSPKMLQADDETRAALRYNAFAEGEGSPVFQKVLGNLAAWQSALHGAQGLVYNDLDAPRNAPDWTQPGYSDSTWTETRLPARFSTLLGRNANGAIRLRKTVSIPERFSGQELVVTYGPVKDFDTFYFNGVRIGATDQTLPGYWERIREYRIPGSLVKAGQAVISIRVFSSWGDGGFTGVADQMQAFLKPYELADAIPLRGTWKMRVEKELDPAQIRGPDVAKAPRQVADELKHIASGLYNGMIHPLHPYGVRGVLWYQGEGNSYRAHNYRFLLKSLVAGWRELWDQGDFPFGIAQLANNGEKTLYQPDGGEMFWAQYTAQREISNSGLIVTLDLMSPEIDTVDTTHYRNKQPVGERFCLWALAKAYGRDVEYSGPEYASMAISGRKAVLSFNHVGRGLMSKAPPEVGDKSLRGFVVAGDDKRFFPARAVIEGDRVVVWADEVPAPRAVRYAWSHNPFADLYNKDGLPASAFRTDDWPWMSALRTPK